MKNTAIKGPQLMEITPALAEQWLSRGGKNRAVSKALVERYAAYMKKGEWVLTGDTIKFSSEGKLLDGQHRLRAVIRSGATILVYVVTADDPRAFMYMDRGKPRSAGDLITIDLPGVKHVSRVAAVGKRLLMWERTPNKKEFTTYSHEFHNMPPEDVKEYVKNHYEEIAEMLEEVKQSLICKKCGSGSSFMAALILCKRADEVAASLFIDAVKTGLNLTEHSPVHLLREKLIFERPAKHRTAIWETEVMALTIKAFNYFAQDKPLKILRWRQEGDTPEYFPIPRGA